MKFGLMVVDKTDNIGDDIQSYAASRFLPEVSFYIDREKLDAFYGSRDGCQVAVIMNAWYMYQKFHWPPSPYIYPLFVSMHISENDYYGIGTRFLDGLGGEFLRQYEPIGARDWTTQAILEKKGIKSYISGCLTLTLDKFEDINKTNIVYLVDIEEKDKRILQEQFPEEEYVEITHDVTYFHVGYEERMQKVEELLKKYQGAKCVITSRLHCALPCLALETPVLLVYKEEYKGRMETYLQHLHVTTSQEIKNNEIGFNIKNPPVNKMNYKTVRDNLKKVCMDFVDRSLNNDRKCGHCDFYEVRNWQDELVNNAELKFRGQITEYRNWCEELEQAKEWNEGRYIDQKKEYDKLYHWCEKLEQAKEWNESQYLNLKEEYNKLCDWCKELEQAKDWNENQYINIRKEYEELCIWCGSLEQAKKWNENQYRNLKKEYEELQNWCDELQKGKVWILNKWRQMRKRKS
ncbi:MAG: polysaccharide pyruvyl transferase family protein [Eubacterium sp.]|nr:polysaccharide pyruvyl transferase family protein [Eubacterium sp.]